MARPSEEQVREAVAGAVGRHAGAVVAVIVDEIPRYGANEMNRIACDALKAAAIFFALKAAHEPTRDKRRVLEVFFETVPDFPQKETASNIWDLYRTGNKDGGEDHRNGCARFVRALDGLVTAA